MKVAYVLNQYPKVSHTFIRREIAALRGLGVSVRTVAMRGWRDAVADPADLAEKEVTHYVLRGGLWQMLRSFCGLFLRRPFGLIRALVLTLSICRGSRKSFFLHLAYFAEACVVARIASTEGIEHLHAHFGTNPADVAMLASLISGIPYSFTVHGPEEFDAPAELRLSEKIRRSAFVVAVSSFGRSQLYRLLDVREWEKVKVVHCGLDEELLGARSTRMAEPGRFVCVGRLCEQKGQLLLLKALRQVLDLGVTCSLILAGDGELREQIEREIAELNLSGHVVVTGWISGRSVIDQVLSARALVLPSFAEGLPVVIMEAMAARRPVISTYVAGIPELVKDGITGWLVPAGDVEALVGALLQALAATDDELQQMGEAGYRRVLHRHDIAVEARKLVDCFKASIASAPS